LFSQINLALGSHGIACIDVGLVTLLRLPSILQVTVPMHPSHGPSNVFSAISSSFAAMMKSFSCRPLIFLV